VNTRDSYTVVAESYRDLVASELPAKIFDRAMLGAFCELVAAAPGPIADIGCGPGHVTAYLSSAGLNVVGIDESPGMIAVARAAYPELRFDLQTMLSLTVSDSSLAGLVARYSTIHLTDAEIQLAFAEFRRVLMPGGYALLDFQVGDERLERTEAYGHPVAITSFRRPVAQVIAALEVAGFEVVAQLTREPDALEKVAQCHLIASRAVAPKASLP
jgi:ubiquinone/menaquinone biosynthesis C-methylase UbiE